MSKKKRDDSYFAADRRKKKKSMMIIIPVIVAVVAVATVGALLYQPPQVMAISGVECNRTEQLSYHVHAHINVFVDGKEQQVPADIGRPSSCLYWLHTHAANGVIHVESPHTQEFTLGQFLDIWQQTSDQAGFFSSVAGMNATVYIDGEQAEGDYRDVPLGSLEQIALVYGEPPASIPDTFNFAAENITR